MKHSSSMLFRAAALVTALSVPALALAQAATQATAAPLPIETFFKKPAFRNPVLSPNGQKFAVLVPSASGRVGLAVANVNEPSKLVGIAQFDDADVNSVRWVNDGRLVFDAIDQQVPLGDQLGSGLYAINADGSDYMWLIKRTWAYSRTGVSPSVNEPLQVNYRFAGVVGDGSDDVLVNRWEGQGMGKPSVTTMMRLNTRTMTTRRLLPGAVPDNVQDWVLDPNRVPRAAMAFDGKRSSLLYWRDLDSNEWAQLDRFDEFEEGRKSWRPVAVDRDGQLYVSAYTEGAADGTTALYRYDVKARKRDEKPLLAVPGFDFEGALRFDGGTKQLLGIAYMQEASGTAWLDKSMRELQAAVDKLLPSTNNTVICDRCIGAKHVIVAATSDIQPPVYFLYERASGKLSLMGQAYPWIDSKQMAGSQDFVRIKARDGMEIPVYVTKPKGKGPFPTVVLIHGGPYVRGGDWGFDPSAQFLASRGYLVVEPEYRGSRGYGDKLFKAGWKQWGLKMQDDMTDATHWAIDQGLADKNRIAIAGASYGGYATMMGLLKEPELYKAGINWVGVTDIELMYTIGWSDFMDADNPWVKYGMPRMIGDPEKDAAQLKATSPLQQASRIKRPVLMAYGEEDYRVPLPHGTKMRDALIASGNKNVEWVQYAGEGHGFMLTKNNVDFWGRVERFLAKHLQ